MDLLFTDGKCRMDVFLEDLKCLSLCCPRRVRLDQRVLLFFLKDMSHDL